MKPGKDQIDKMEEVFKAVHGKERNVTVTPAWEAKVMRAVRTQAGQPAGKLFDAEMLGHLVWRFAMATCLVALLFTAYTMAVDPGASADVAKLFFEDPLAFDLVNTLEAV